jgi:hypothetical protein
MMRIHSCYDNGGATVDQYTVVFTERDRQYYQCLAMSDYPDHPQGFSQWASATPGEHLGRKFRFGLMPAHIKKHVYDRMNDGGEREPLYDEAGKLYEPTEADKEDAKRHREENRMFYLIGGV